MVHWTVGTSDLLGPPIGTLVGISWWIRLTCEAVYVPVRMVLRSEGTCALSDPIVTSTCVNSISQNIR